MQETQEQERERLAAIGRAVVEYLHPDNPRALREATPALVVDHVRRTEVELRTLEGCRALRVGRLMLSLETAIRTAGE